MPLQRTQQVQQIQNTVQHVSPLGQTIVTQHCQNLQLAKISQINTNHTAAVLCAIFIYDKYIATGSKDNTINIYTLEGKKVATLEGH